jgi:hypothetical protein
MLTTRRPMHRGASAPSASNRGVPKELDEIVLKALSPNAETRFQSAAAFAGALRGSVAVLDALGIPGEEEQLMQTQSTGIGRIAAMAGGMLIVAVVLAWWFWSQAP